MPVMLSEGWQGFCWQFLPCSTLALCVLAPLVILMHSERLLRRMGKTQYWGLAMLITLDLQSVSEGTCMLIMKVYWYAEESIHLVAKQKVSMYVCFDLGMVVAMKVRLLAFLPLWYHHSMQIFFVVLP